MKPARAAFGRPPGALPARTDPLMFGVMAVLVLTMLGPVMTIGTATALTGEGSPLRQAAYLLVTAVIAYGVRPTADPRRLLALPLGIALALGWCWISLAWSIAPGIAVRRLILTTMIIWSIFAGVRQLGYEKTLLLLRVVLIAALIANYLTVLVWPELGIHQADDVLDKNLIGDWRGMMMQKNITGPVCAVTILVFLIDAGRVPIALRAAVIAAAAFFLWKTGSRTSISDCVGAGAIGFLFLFYNARYRMLVMPLAFVALAVLASLTNVFVNPIQSVLDQKATLSGRVEIWEMLTRYTADHQMLGAGYGSFWNIGPQSPVFSYGKGWLTNLASGHNGFLDLIATIGFPGLLIVIAGVVVQPLVRLFRSREAGGAPGALIFAILTFCIVHNATESTLFDRDQITQVFLMFAIAMLWALTSRERAGAPGMAWRRRAGATSLRSGAS